MSSIEQTCGICLCSSLNYNLDSPCSYSQLHTFHKECIEQWLATIYSKCLHIDPRCPTCRTVLTRDYIDNSKLNYLKTSYPNETIEIATVESIRWLRRLNPLDKINAGYPFYLEPIVYIKNQIGYTKTLKLATHTDITYLGLGVGSRFIACISPPLTNIAKILYVYNKETTVLPRQEDYVSNFPGKALEFVWIDNRYTAHVYNQVDLVSNRQQYMELLSGFYNPSVYIDDSYTVELLAEINSGSPVLLISLLDTGKVPNSSEHYEYTILSKCIEKGLYDVAIRILNNPQYFPTTVDLMEAVENGGPNLYSLVIGHNHFVETRFSRNFIERNPDVPQEAKNLYRNKFNYVF